MQPKASGSARDGASVAVARARPARARGRVPTLRQRWALATRPPVHVARSRLPTSATAARIHAFTRHQVLRRRAGDGARAWWLAWALWYGSATLGALVNTARYGPAIRARSGRGLARQAAEQLAMAWWSSIPPKTYYRYRFYETGARARAGDYLHRFETKMSLYRFLARDLADGERLQDKVVFARDCRRHGLRTAPVLMELRDGRAYAVEADVLPPRDLVVKPTLGRGGRGVEGWRHRGDGRYAASADRVLDRDALLRYLCERSRREPCLTQPRLANHPAIADLGRGILTTVRMITCLDERGDGEVTNATFRLGGDDPIVDNMHRGGIAAAVDLRSGRLGPAIGLHPTSDWTPVVPATGVAVAGRLLPWWREAVELACRAHRLFAGCAVVGWDMALLEDGPCLVEGNFAPCVDLIQVPLGGPIGSGRFGELVVRRIAEIEAEERARS